MGRFTVSKSRLKGRGVRATELHPGGIQTELGRHMTPELRAQIQKRIAASKEAATFKYKTIPQGAATTVWASFVAQRMRLVAITARIVTYAR